MSGRDRVSSDVFFFFNDTATTEIYTLSLHDALPICGLERLAIDIEAVEFERKLFTLFSQSRINFLLPFVFLDRKSTRLNSSHANISYAVFCLKKKNSRRYCLLSGPCLPYPSDCLCHL